MASRKTLNHRKPQDSLVMIPISYSIRNLFRRPTQSIQLIGGCALVVLLIMLAASMNQAMEKTLQSSGSEKNVILLGAGSEESIERSEISTNINEIAASSIKGVRKVFNEPAISGEVHYNGIVSLPDGSKAQALLRGVRYQALWVHQQVRIINGRFPESGEVMIGRLAYQKLGFSKESLAIGKYIIFNREKLKIVGIFDARGTVMEAEVWANLGDLMTLTQRESLSCAVLSLDRNGEFADSDMFTKQRLDLELVAVSEADYYANLSSFFAPIRWMAWVCAILISTGALFGGLNTLYAAFSARIREFGALQAIGFTRRSLLYSLTQESSIASIIGSIIAFGFALGFLQGVSFPFSIGVFVLDFDPYVIKIGLVTGITLGLLGGIPPAWSCLRPSLPETLRSS